MSTNRYLESLKRANNIAFTENGAISNRSTLSPVLDFFSTCGALRTRTEESIVKLFSRAFADSPLYALKSLFYCRDIRGGQGERRTPKIILKWLAKQHTDILRKNIALIPEYGRWDDLFELMETPLEEDVIKLIANQLALDQSTDPSLLAKWMPSENASSKQTKALARKLIQKLEFTPKQYRKMLVKLRNKINIIETKMCANNWEEIEFDKVPSRASLIYRKAFSKHTPEQYVEFLNSVEKGEKKINVATLFPYDLIHQIFESNRNNDNDKSIELMWQNQPNYITEGESAIVVADTSGSMRGRPIEVCISLAMYFAERNTGIWKDYFITFSNNPTLQRVCGSTLRDKVFNLVTTNWDYNTNVQAVFDLLLMTAVQNRIPKEEMLKKIYIVSDMEFDSATVDGTSTNFNVIQQKYQRSGYEMPTLVFWNVNSRNTQQPVTIDDKGVYMVSGCSPTIFKQILSSKTVTAIDLMKEVLDQPRYNKIVL